MDDIDMFMIKFKTNDWTFWLYFFLLVLMEAKISYKM